MRRLNLGTVSFGLAMAALCLGERSAHAQSAAVQYLPLSAAFGADLGGGFAVSRYDLPNGWFLGGGKSGASLSANSFNSTPAFGTLSGFSREGFQFGYNFKDSGTPFSVYAGFDTLKSTGTGSIFAPFSSQSVPGGYTASAGVEFRPTSNLSLQLGASVTQFGRVDDNNRAPVVSTENPYSMLGMRPQ